MKPTKLKRPLILAMALVVLFSISGKAQAKKGASKTKDQSAIFPKGTRAPAENFTGTAWVTALLPNDSTYTTAIGNVVFEPGARSNWHSHPAGQILIVTEGKGYHQIKGEPKQVIKKGDVVKCPPDVLHWHGASPESSMAHLYVLPNTEKGIVKWMHPVSDEEYKVLK
jgi:quercetin dioxygenase-like cupin family protein